MGYGVRRGGNTHAMRTPMSRFPALHPLKINKKIGGSILGTMQCMQSITLSFMFLLERMDIQCVCWALIRLLPFISLASFLTGHFSFSY